MEVTCRDGFYRVRARTAHRLRCPPVTVISLTVEVVRRIWEGRPVERVIALAGLTEGQRLLLFPTLCGCGADHSKLAANMLRCTRLCHEALALANELEVPLRDLINISAVQGETDRQTDELQVEAVRRWAFAGAPVPASPEHRTAA